MLNSAETHVLARDTETSTLFSSDFMYGDMMQEYDDLPWYKEVLRLR